jgi:hypothetical protein
MVEWNIDASQDALTMGLQVGKETYLEWRVSSLSFWAYKIQSQPETDLVNKYFAISKDNIPRPRICFRRDKM